MHGLLVPPPSLSYTACLANKLIRLLRYIFDAVIIPRSQGWSLSSCAAVRIVNPLLLPMRICRPPRRILCALLIQAVSMIKLSTQI